MEKLKDSIFRVSLSYGVVLILSLIASYPIMMTAQDFNLELHWYTTPVLFSVLFFAVFVVGQAINSSLSIEQFAKISDSIEEVEILEEDVVKNYSNTENYNNTETFSKIKIDTSTPISEQKEIEEPTDFVEKSDDSIERMLKVKEDKFNQAEKLINDFKSDHPKVKVNFNYFNDGYSLTVLDTDLGYVNSSPDVDENNILERLDGIFAEYSLKKAETLI